MREIEVRNGRLFFGGCDVTKLAEEYGTPLYVVDEQYIRERCQEIVNTFVNKWEGARAVYASKALQTLDICKIIKSEGLGFDTVSGGEIYAAIKSGADPATFVFHGNNKTEEEIDFALKSGVGRFVTDNYYELKMIDRRCAALGKKAKVQLRITPGVDSHTHEFISTGNIDSKFGISLERESRNEVIKYALDSDHIEFMGFHFHVGSQLMENNSHLLALNIILDMIKEVKADLGAEIKELNLGGGFGIRYVDGEETVKVSDFTDPMMEKISEFCKKENMNMPAVYIEPGRWIAGNAGITLYTVGSIKEIPGIKTYLAVDGGMPDNPRHILYEAKYEAVVANRASEPCSKLVTVVGKCCESGDVLIKDIKLPENTKGGDILAVFSTGAYNYSMASNYNRLPRPAMVVVNNGKSRLSVRRETYEDMISREI